MQELRDLRDPDKPHRRVFLCDDGTFVKVHAKAQPVGFGRIQWTFSGSHCDSEGRAYPHQDGFAIHSELHELVIASDTENQTAEERAEDIRAAFDAALAVCVRRVQTAVINEAAALAVYLD